MTNEKLIALTFDDGPSNVTNDVLDILEKEQIPATFFLIGENIVPEYKDTLIRELNLNCEIANHSFTHSDMTTLEPSVIKDEIEKTTALIKEYTNVDPRFFRPPYISVDDKMFDNISLPFIRGLGCNDWDFDYDAEYRIKTMLEAARDGLIYLLHDLTDNHPTVEALPVVIKELKKQGYKFVTLSDLFKLKNVDPNQKNKLWTNVFE